MADNKSEKADDPEWVMWLYVIFLTLWLYLAGRALIHFAHRPEGIRVEFEHDYKCAGMRGKVYWLHPEVAQKVLEKKRAASSPFYFGTCELRSVPPSSGYLRYCEIHQIGTLPYKEGLRAWFVNY